MSERKSIKNDRFFGRNFLDFLNYFLDFRIFPDFNFLFQFLFEKDKFFIYLFIFYFLIFIFYLYIFILFWVFLLNSVQKKLFQFWKIPKVNVRESSFSFYLCNYGVIAVSAMQQGVKFEVLKRCYIQIYPAKFLLCYEKTITLQHM